MIFNSIYLEESGDNRRIDFSDRNNLVHSIANSKGKTTLLRLLLYSIGYNIPNTKQIRFENCKVESQITLDNGDIIFLNRTCREYIVLKKGDEERTFVLPSEETDLHRIIFHVENLDLINNLLGTYYYDQEKGWTLLNRGTVIGSIHFNVEELIRGIGNIDCSELKLEKETKKRDRQKYEQMFSLSKYQETIDRETENLAAEPFNSKLASQIEQLRMEKNILRKELRRIDKVLKENNTVRKYIAEIDLMVKTPNGDIIAVTEDNIVGLKDSIDFLIAKQRIKASQFNQLENEIQEIEKRFRIEEQQLHLFDNSETLADIFDQQISTIPINEITVKNAIDQLDKEIKDINKQIKDRTYAAREVIKSILKNLSSYMRELDLDSIGKPENVLFTSNLKELSGALLHKTIFAVRMACLKEVEKQLEIRLPIILDSPSGKEIDKENIEAMIQILKKDFSDHQIIIASIFEYDLENINTIKIENRLIE